MTIVRYALYYGPRPDSALHRFGTDWFGTDPETGEDVPIRPLEGIGEPRHRAITATPRHYALHGTLKPPFRLAPDTDRAGLEAAVAALAARHAPVRLGKPALRRLGGFLALCPVDPPDRLHALAAACVEVLDPFRAAPTKAELDKRRAAGLSPRQEALLRRWGYPYVMEEFRFHVTLTGSLEPAVQAEIADALAPRLAPVLAEPMDIEDLCLYGEPEDGSPFRVLARFALTGPS